VQFIGGCGGSGVGGDGGIMKGEGDLADIALCMIVTDGRLEQLERCLESAAPHVDEIVVARTRKKWPAKQRRLFKRFGVKSFPYVWGDDFAAARQASFEAASSPWRMWLDDDDELHGGEHLRKVLAGLKVDRWMAPQVGLQMPYYYGYDDVGNPTTILTRTRVVWWEAGWRWRGRIHEDLEPLGVVEMARQADVVVVHRPADDDHGDTSAERNYRILLLELEEEGENWRTLGYLGHQAFALRRWEEAVHWYERYLRVAPATMQRWQAQHYQAVCLMRAERWADASAAEFACLELAPQYKDPYFGLAEIAYQMGDAEEAVYWYEAGMRAEVPPSTGLFFNPLDYQFNNVLVGHLAYQAVGAFDKALGEVERGLQVRPHDGYLLGQRDKMRELMAHEEKARAFAVVAWQVDAEQVGRLEEAVGQETVRAFGPSRDLAWRAEFQRQVSGAGYEGQRVVILCGDGPEPFNPVAVEAGMGGSETAVIRVAEGMAARGARVQVFNNPGMEAGAWKHGRGELGFWPWRWWDPELPCDLFVAWRRPELGAGAPAGVESWLWLHDLHVGDRFTPELAARFDLIRPVSAWAGEYLQQVYPWLDAGKVVPTRNGTDWAPGSLELGAVVWDAGRARRCIYASSPDRGLEHLLRMWPEVRLVVEEAELHIYYGWEVWDRTMAARRDKWMARVKGQIMRGLEQPGVFWHGRVSKAELREGWRLCGTWAYPTEFLEVSCMTAMDAMAAGAAVLTSEHGALPETLGDVGIRLHGPAGGVRYQQRFLGYLTEVLSNEEIWVKAAKGGPDRARALQWPGVAEEWLRRMRREGDAG